MHPKLELQCVPVPVIPATCLKTVAVYDCDRHVDPPQSGITSPVSALHYMSNDVEAGADLVQGAFRPDRVIDSSAGMRGTTDDRPTRTRGGAPSRVSQYLCGALHYRAGCTSESSLTLLSKLFSLCGDLFCDVVAGMPPCYR